MVAAPSHRRRAVNGFGLFDGPEKEKEPEKAEQLENDLSPQVPWLAPTAAPSAGPSWALELASPGDNGDQEEPVTISVAIGGQAPHRHAAVAHVLFLFPLFICVASIVASMVYQSRRHKDLYSYLQNQTSSLGVPRLPRRRRQAATTTDPTSPLRIHLAGTSSGSIRMERKSRIEYVSAVLKTKVLTDEDLQSPKTPFFKERKSSSLFVGDGIEKEDRLHIISFRKSRSGSICTASMDSSCTDSGGARSSSKSSRQGSLFTPDENDNLLGGFIRKASGSLTNHSSSPPNSTAEDGGYVEVDLLGMNDSMDGTKPDEDDEEMSEDPLELSNFGLDSKSCAICLGEYQPGDEICWSDNTRCPHAFHKACMVDWLVSHEDCPCCRVHYLRDDADDDHNGRNDNGGGCEGGGNWNEIV